MTRALLLLFLVACVKSKPEPASVDAAAPSASIATPQATGFSVETCEALLIEAERDVATIRQSTGKACTSDADCVLAESTVCIPGCKDFAMTKSGLTAYNSSVAKTRSHKCETWTANGCPQTTPKAKPECSPKTAKCENATCVAR